MAYNLYLMVYLMSDDYFIFKAIGMLNIITTIAVLYELTARAINQVHSDNYSD